MSTNIGPGESQEEVFFENYKPPSRDAITLPQYIFYLIIAAVVVMTALFAIIRHLIKDLIHDLADWLFGEQPEEASINPWENKDKFVADWCPETTPELEEMARAEQVKLVMEGNKNMPAIWVISDAREPRPPRSGPRVAFGKMS